MYKHMKHIHILGSLRRLLKQNKLVIARPMPLYISGPLGEVNNLLMFTDALVINKARWMAADEEKKKAIIAFVQYFLSTSLRYDIAMGADLKPHRVRYLLQATEEFYCITDNIIYQDLFWSLSRAVAVLSLTLYQKYEMREVLTRLCVKISPNENSSTN